MSMKILPVFYLLLVAVYGQEFECPKDAFNNCVNGDYPVEGVCTQYYDCVDCQKRVEECPPGQHFNPDLQQCTDPYSAGCDPDYQAFGSLFSVARTSIGDGNVDNDPLIFQEIIINDDAYNSGTGIYTANQGGVYFFHLSTGARPTVSIDANVDDGRTTLHNIKRDSTAHTGVDVVARDMLIDIPAFDSFDVKLGLGTGVGYRAFSRHTSWSGFHLQEYMNSVQAFSATRDTDATNPGTIVFGNSLLDYGDIYNPLTGRMTAPQAGIYYLTFSTGLRASNTHRSRLMSSSKGSICELYRQNWSHNDFDTLSRSTLVYLEVNEQVYVNLISGQAANTQDTLLTFSGFLYNPVNTAAQAWSVHRTLSDDGLTGDLTFGVIDVNEGNLFSSASHRVTIAVSGYYFITMSIGAEANEPVDVDLVVEYQTGDQVEAAVERTVGYQGGVDTISRSIMLDLPAGCNLRLRRNSPSHVFSNSFHITSWSGFMVAEPTTAP